MSKLSDGDVATQLREMGLDIGPVNAATRSVYQRKLERLSLEQSTLAAVFKNQTPSRKQEISKTPDNSTQPPTGQSPSMEDHVEYGKTEEESFRLEADEEECFRLAADEEELFRLEMEEADRVESLVRAAELINKKLTRGSTSQSLDDDVSTKAKESYTDHTYFAKGAMNNDWNYESEESGMSLRPTFDDFSSAPLTRPGVKISAAKMPGNGRGDADTGLVRQRTVPFSRDDVYEVDSYKRIELKPEDYIPSARSPLPSYLDRVTPSTSTVWQHDRLTALKPVDKKTVTTSSQSGQPFWIKVAILLTLILFLILIVLFNMEAGYKSPV